MRVFDPFEKKGRQAYSTALASRKCNAQAKQSFTKPQAHKDLFFW